MRPHEQGPNPTGLVASLQEEETLEIPLPFQECPGRPVREQSRRAATAPGREVSLESSPQPWPRSSSLHNRKEHPSVV